MGIEENGFPFSDVIIEAKPMSLALLLTAIGKTLSGVPE